MSRLTSARKRAIVLGLCGVCLFLAVFGTNLAIGAERSVLDADYVADGLESSEMYDEMAADLAADFGPDSENATDGSAGGPVQPPMDELAKDVVTPAYVRGQYEGMIENVYAYLHGETDELVLVIDNRPIKEGMATAAANWVRETDLENLDPETAEMAESQSQFDATRAGFTDDQLQEIQADTEEEHDRAELEEIYDDRRPEIRESMIAELEAETAEGGQPPAMQEATVAFGTVRVDALLDEGVSYEEFLDRLASAREDLAVATGEAIAAEMNEGMDDQTDVTADMDEGALATFQAMRTGVTVTGLLVFVLPLASLGLAGAIGYVSPSRSRGLRRVGTVVGVVGLLGVALGLAVFRVLPGLLGGGSETTGSQAATIGLVEGAGTLFAIQSAVVLGLGIALVAAAVALREGVLPVEDRRRPWADADGASDGDEGPNVDGEPGSDEPDADTDPNGADVTDEADRAGDGEGEREPGDGERSGRERADAER